jgi:hypothetical protein
MELVKENLGLREDGCWSIYPKRDDRQICLLTCSTWENLPRSPRL